MFTDDEEANCEILTSRWTAATARLSSSRSRKRVATVGRSNSYQFRLHNLTEERYGFSASDTVTIVAVQGDLDAYMEDYASGNSIADLGTSFCCISILLHVFIGRGIAKRVTPNNRSW